MKLIYVTSSLPFGRQEAFFYPEIEYLVKEGHEVLVVPMWPRGEDFHASLQGKQWSVAAEGLFPGAAFWQLLKAPLRKRETLKRAAGAVLGSRSSRIAAKNATIVPKALWLGALARRWGARHIHAQWASTTATMAWLAAEDAGIPWSFTAHRWDIGENNLLEEKFESAAFVRVISDDGARELREAVTSRLHQKLRVIRMGVRVPARPAPLGKLIASQRAVILGNLVEKKGHSVLLEAWSSLVHQGVGVTLDIVGGGPLEGVLRAQARRLGIGDKVVFHGPKPHDAVLQSLADGEWRFMVLPSIVTSSGELEGIPVALMEAMAAGIPVVSTSTGGIPEMLRDGAGVMVPPGDAASLSAAMRELIDSSEAVSQVGKAGFARIRNEYAISVVGRMVADSIVATTIGDGL